MGFFIGPFSSTKFCDNHAVVFFIILLTKQTYTIPRTLTLEQEMESSYVFFPLRPNVYGLTCSYPPICFSSAGWNEKKQPPLCAGQIKRRVCVREGFQCSTKAKHTRLNLSDTHSTTIKSFHSALDTIRIC